MKVYLDNWSTAIAADPYTAPELIKMYLRGIVTGHPKKKDGTYVRTSSIISVDKREVTTRHTTYTLGKIDPAYRKWLSTYYPNWDWRQPLGEINE